jgi:hypothetical protein
MEVSAATATSPPKRSATESRHPKHERNTMSMRPFLRSSPDERFARERLAA